MANNNKPRNGEVKERKLHDNGNYSQRKGVSPKFIEQLKIGFQSLYDTKAVKDLP